MSSQPAINSESREEVVLGAVRYRLARAEDESVIQHLLEQNEMTSWISITTEHKPSYFASQNLYGERVCIIGEQVEDGVPVGMGSFVLMPGHVNGKPSTVGYLSELRIQSAFRHRFSIVRNAYKAVWQLGGGDCPDVYWFSSIATENSHAKRLLESDLPGKPRYRPIGQLHTLAIPASERKKVVVEKATPADLTTLTGFYNKVVRSRQFSPVLDAAWLTQDAPGVGLSISDFFVLKRRGQIIACFALWDQRRLKQAVVRGYRFPLSLFRPAYNIAAKMTGRVTLPPVGGTIDYIFMSFLAVDDDVSQREFQQVVDSARSLVAQRGARLLMLGLSETSPLLSWTEPYPKEIYHTCIEQVSWPRQSLPDLTLSTVQPEIAVL